MKTLLNIFSKLGVRVPADLTEERQKDEGYSQCLGSVHLSASRGAFVVGGYTSCLP